MSPAKAKILDRAVAAADERSSARLGGSQKLPDSSQSNQTCPPLGDSIGGVQ